MPSSNTEKYHLVQMDNSGYICFFKVLGPKVGLIFDVRALGNRQVLLKFGDQRPSGRCTTGFLLIPQSPKIQSWAAWRQISLFIGPNLGQGTLKRQPFAIEFSLSHLRLCGQYLTIYGLLKSLGIRISCRSAQKLR